MNHEIHEAHEKAETLAEIVAEMRKNKGFPVPYAPSGHNGVWTTDLVEYANRIEAAWRRERAEIEADALSVGGVVEAAAKRATADKSSAVGDAAAMREALTKVSEWMAHRIATCGFEASPTLPTVLEDVVLPALSAPPRNCDRFKDRDEAQDAFEEQYSKDAVEKMKRYPLAVLDAFCDWLFLPTNESEVK